MDDAKTPFGHLSYISTIITCFIFSFVYVLGLYLLSPSSRRYERNHPHVIARRFFAVFIVCSLIYLFLKYSCQMNVNINVWLGFRTDISSIWIMFFYPILLTLMLYFGPIIQWIDLYDWNYYKYNWRHCLSFHDTNEQLIFIRNYLVAPFTEEFVFRSSILCLLYPHISSFSAMFLSPLFFGLAHFHHMIEHYKQNQHERYNRLSVLTIIFVHLFQFSYTYIFGVYSSFLFIRTGHFVPSFISHALCNCLGLPDVMNLINMQDGQIKRKIFLMICYLIGLWLFSTNLYFLTQSNFYYSNNSAIIYQQWSS